MTIHKWASIVQNSSITVWYWLVSGSYCHGLTSSVEFAPRLNEWNEPCELLKAVARSMPRGVCGKSRGTDLASAAAHRLVNTGADPQGPDDLHLTGTQRIVIIYCNQWLINHCPENLIMICIDQREWSGVGFQLARGNGYDQLLLFQVVPAPWPKHTSRSPTEGLDPGASCLGKSDESMASETMFDDDWWWLILRNHYLWKQLTIPQICGWIFPWLLEPGRMKK